MSTRRHKRRRVDRDPVLDERLFEPTPPAVGDTHAEGTEATADPELAVEAPKGIEGDSEAFAEIWDSFREEHYEVLEQLPLTLHRVFRLIHELDGQAQERISNLSPAILKYVSLRRALADADQGAGEQGAQGEVPEGEPVHDAPSTSGDQQATETRNTNGNGKLSNGSSLSPPPVSSAGAPSTKSRTTPVPPKSLAAVVESSDSTREVLISIAQSAEEISRATNEKYYLAGYVRALVDRYIRDLDRSIKEQEASITLGLRPGTHPASIILPEVVLPKPNRSRIVTSPPPFEIPMDPLLLPQPVIEPPSEEVQETPTPAEEETPDPPPAPEEQDEPVEIVESEEPVVEMVEPPAPTRGKRKGRKRRKSKRTRSEAPPTEEQAAPEETLEPEAEEEDAPIPAQNLAPQPLVEPELLDPNEPRYCFCNQVSYGEMIACDNPSCEREWFHMGCVGVTKTPKGKWYCRECIDKVKRPKHKRRPR
ncbi:hypothetical protein C8Q80DRAFT_1316285 [Daedaleopsis nitida]|nr:hypothetical protein C8Q80DRAFT_1316285 [Daedaleopsis nitida]